MEEPAAGADVIFTGTVTEAERKHVHDRLFSVDRVSMGRVQAKELIRTQTCSDPIGPRIGEPWTMRGEPG